MNRLPKAQHPSLSTTRKGSRTRRARDPRLRADGMPPPPTRPRTTRFHLRTDFRRTQLEGEEANPPRDLHSSTPGGGGLGQATSPPPPWVQALIKASTRTEAPASRRTTWKQPTFSFTTVDGSYLEPLSHASYAPAASQGPSESHPWPHSPSARSQVGCSLLAQAQPLSGAAPSPC